MSLNFSYHKCIVKKCLPLLHDENVGYHLFPKDLDRKNHWIQIMKPENLSLECKGLYLCSRHFDKNQYGKSALKKTAVPYLQSKYAIAIEESTNNKKLAISRCKLGNLFRYMNKDLTIKTSS